MGKIVGGSLMGTTVKVIISGVLLEVPSETESVTAAEPLA
jgi:hypothetical protein